MRSRPRTAGGRERARPRRNRKRLRLNRLGERRFRRAQRTQVKDLSGDPGPGSGASVAAVRDRSAPVASSRKRRESASSLRAAAPGGRVTNATPRRVGAAGEQSLTVGQPGPGHAEGPPAALRTALREARSGADGLDLQLDVDLVAEQGLLALQRDVELDPPVLAVDRGLGGEPGARA